MTPDEKSEWVNGPETMAAENRVHHSATAQEDTPGPQTHEEARQFHEGWKTIETFEKLPIGVIDNMRQLLKDYERWEADLVLCGEAWDTKDGLPKLTRELHDRLIQLQLRRNVLLASPKGA